MKTRSKKATTHEHHIQQHDHTHITVILDRTGSMQSIRDDTIGGFNTFLASQQKAGTDATLTLVQFDSQDPYEVVHHMRPIADVPKLTPDTYVPRASTPLLDAMGRGINDLAASLAKVPESARPAKVVFVIVTDGQENASQEFTKVQVEKMIKEHQEKDNWQFLFLSADMGAVEEARALGVHARASAAFVKDGVGTAHAWACVSESIAAFRSDESDEVVF